MNSVSFPLNELRTLFHLSGTSEQLRDPASCFYPYIGLLNRRIQQVSSDEPRNALLKGIWQEFSASLAAPQSRQTQGRLAACVSELSKQFPEGLNRGIFSNTDLLVYPDGYEDRLPINGITESQLQRLQILYLQFTSLLRMGGCGAFQERLLKDVRMILSRPLGRELIAQIVSRMTQPGACIYIAPGEESLYMSNEGKQFIQYCTSPPLQLHALPNGESVSLKSPAFLTLAHELIHLLHNLNGEMSHIDDPTVPTLNTNREESRTIFGDCGTALLNPCHPPSQISENALRKQFFGILLRSGHHAGYVHEGCAKCNFVFAARYGITGNVRQLVRHVSGNTLSQTIQRQLTVLPTPTTPNPGAAVEAIIDEMMKS